MKLRRPTRMAVGYVTAACVAACIIVTALLLVSSSQSPIIFDLALVRPLVSLAALIAAFAAFLGVIVGHEQSAVVDFMDCCVRGGFGRQLRRLYLLAHRCAIVPQES